LGTLSIFLDWRPIFWASHFVVFSGLGEQQRENHSEGGPVQNKDRKNVVENIARIALKDVRFWEAFFQHLVFVEAGVTLRPSCNTDQGVCCSRKVGCREIPNGFFAIVLRRRIAVVVLRESHTETPCDAQKERTRGESKRDIWIWKDEVGRSFQECIAK